MNLRDFAEQYLPQSLSSFKSSFCLVFPAKSCKQADAPKAAATWSPEFPLLSRKAGSAPNANKSSIISNELSRIARCKGVCRKGIIWKCAFESDIESYLLISYYNKQSFHI